MDHYLHILGLKRSTPETQSMRIYHIKNGDGSVRWFWNAQNPNPDFLRFYAVSGIRAAVFSWLITLLFKSGLQHVFFYQRSMRVSVDASHTLATYFKGNFAVFTGTVGPNQKLVVYAKSLFIKVALNEQSLALLQNEEAILKQLQHAETIEIPEAKILSDGILSVTDIRKGAKRINVFTPAHARAVYTFNSYGDICDNVCKQTAVYNRSINRLKQVQLRNDPRIPHHLMQKLYQTADELAEEHIELGLCHGDFTPWNCFIRNNHIHVYDFELAAPYMPYAFDVFHFVMQQAVLVDRLPWQHIQERLRAAYRVFAAETGRNETHFKKYLKAYLLVNTSYYLELYSRQQHWHQQVNWLLQSWNDALSDLTGKPGTLRSLLIGDVLDFLNNHRYAVLKFQDIHQYHVSAYSDLDVLLEKGIATDLVKWLRTNRLIKRIRCERLTYMHRVFLELQDESVLALDLIWKLKRRQLEYMKVPDMLNDVYVNEQGVRVVRNSTTQRYIEYFYGLNGSAIPEKYRDSNVHQKDTVELQKSLTKEIKRLPENRGIKGIVNTVAYLWDTFKTLVRPQGAVITFSGVDGAGKSTIIQQISTVLEKKFRRRVVVIRHRPSMLPIISSIRHGKKQAEAIASANLPRQGTNTNVFSSLLRFGYYYTDYVFGQFYVWLKYVMRGYVVLYDRYYFDFINDGLRSNIRLPKWFTKAGYTLLLKPDLNFFLYADPDIIRFRKQELDATTIGQLTSEYKQLFSELERKHGGRYYAIENTELHRSVDFIIRTALNNTI